MPALPPVERALMVQRPPVLGFVCAVCAAHFDIAQACSWRCPRATDTDRHHVLRIVELPGTPRIVGESDPFLAFRRSLAWDAFAAANGVTDAARDAMVRSVGAAVAAVAGTSFHITPFERADALSDELGFSADGGVWVKDETAQVAGSHKSRHLLTILLHLLTAESLGLAGWQAAGGGRPRSRPTLAIASCGNAAYAAATLAAAVDWPLRVFVPPAANPAVVARLRELHADVIECPRRAVDPAGDPCIHRFREAVAGGAIPFTVQGTENAWCHDGGRTIGWELAADAQEAGSAVDRVFVQVGAGTFASSLMAGWAAAGDAPRLHAVQTDSCAPLARAWSVAERLGGPDQAARHWAECMWPWERVGASAADGILDDETYDWLTVLAAMSETSGRPVVASEHHVLAANEVARRTTGIAVSHTGTAGLAGLLAIRDDVGHDERVAVVFSGVAR